MTPDFEVLAAGINITSQVKDRLMSLTVTDEAGFKSDAVAISLDDRDGEVDLPFSGAPLVVAMGYEETFLMPMGLYTSDEVVMKGMSATLTIRGKAADMGGSIKEQKTRSWDEKTIREIVEEIAAEHGLEAQVAEAYADFFYEHLDQTDESDINFLTRIGKDHDAIVSVKGGALLFVGKGEGKTALGLPMIPRFIYRTGKTAYSATLAKPDNFKTVAAFWHDHKTGARRCVTEGQIIAIGFRVGIDGLWSVKSVTQAITGSGYKTTIRCEKPKQKAARRGER